MRAATLTVADLLDLWHGDIDVEPVYSTTLVVAVCEQAQPATQPELHRIFYPDIPRSVLGEDAFRALQRGYLTWRANQ